MRDHLFQVAGELEESKSYEDILHVLTRELQLLGVRQFAYIMQINKRFISPPVIIFTNYSQDWFGHYVASRYYEIDPIMDYALTADLPLFWSTEDDWQASSGDTAAFFMQELKNFFGKTCGVCIPIVSGNISTTGFLNLVLREYGKPQFEQVASANLIIRYVHQNALRIWEETSDSTLYSLSPREKEALVHACDGLTSNAIAEELLISKRTVDAHINSAIVKLGVSNRQQALTKAVSLGLIRPRSVQGEDVLEAVTLVI